MPDLIIIAGCNGTGKSTFASSFLPDGLVSFDYDKLFLEYYNELPDSEFREKFAKDKTTKAFKQVINNSLISKSDFCYETNFDEYPLYWVEKFKAEGFTINLIFFAWKIKRLPGIELRSEQNLKAILLIIKQSI